MLDVLTCTFVFGFYFYHIILQCVCVCVVKPRINPQTWPRVFIVVISKDETLRVSVHLEWDSVWRWGGGGK